MDDERPDPAADHLEATIVPRDGSAAAKVWRTIANVALGVVSGDPDAGPSTTELVVTRTDTGREIMRTRAGGLAEADRLLMQVRDDLETMSVAEFLSEWRLPEDLGDARSDEDRTRDVD